MDEDRTFLGLVIYSAARSRLSAAGWLACSAFLPSLPPGACWRVLAYKGGRTVEAFGATRARAWQEAVDAVTVLESAVRLEPNVRPWPTGG